MYKIMLVEDEDDLRQGIKAFLEIAGYETIEAANGKEAMQKISETVPDIIISDIMMPVMNGLELLKKVRQQSLLKSTPFIILTAKTDLEDVKTGMEAGACHYITKPFKIKELINVISNNLPIVN
ncbi:MAG: response regulator transcription factor [Ignavibacteriales bacterium]